MKHKFFERRLPCRSPLFRVLRAGLVLGAVCCLVLALGSCGGQTETETAPHSDLPVILVGSDNYPPFHYEDANGQPTGIDVDLAKEAFRRMGYQAMFVTIDWEDKKDLVERGEIDCIWGSFSIDGREDQYLWTEPYLYSRQVVAVRQDSDIQTLADLAGKRVAVQSTTKPEELFLAHTDPRIPPRGGGLFPARPGADLSLPQQGLRRRPRGPRDRHPAMYVRLQPGLPHPGRALADGGAGRGLRPHGPARLGQGTLPDL